MKKIILVMFFFITLNCNALTLPKAGDGIKIVPLSELGLSEKELQDDRIEMAEIHSKGYKELMSYDARKLMDMRHNDHLFSVKNELDPYWTGLKRNLKDIKLAFIFNGLSFVKPENILGYAVAATYMNGWTGVSEYFNYPEIGTCNYLIYNVALTKSATILREDLVRYDVNKKPTEIDIEGENQSGFLYKIFWFDNTYFHELDCASVEYSESMKSKIIALANKIDREIK